MSIAVPNHPYSVRFALAEYGWSVDFIVFLLFSHFEMVIKDRTSDLGRKSSFVASGLNGFCTV